MTISSTSAITLFGLAAHLAMTGADTLSIYAAVLGGLGTLLLAIAALSKEIRSTRERND